MKKNFANLTIALLFVISLIFTIGLPPSMASAATTVLPVGATMANLQDAINTAATGDNIVISGNMAFTGSVAIPAGKTLTIESVNGNSWILTQTVANTRHFLVAGTLILQNIILDGGDIGGGVNATNSATLTMNTGAVIRNCRTSSNGGAVLISGNSTFNMTGGSINGNTANSGGGLYVAADSTVNITGASAITNNTATQNGGGIYTADTTYANLATAGTTVFNGNSAVAAHLPPTNATTLYPDIAFTSTSVLAHPLNNYDINHQTGTILTVTANFDSKGGSAVASQTVNYGSALTRPADPTRAGYTFGGWYRDDETFLVAWDFDNDIAESDTTLYAKWTLTSHTVTFDSNEGSDIPSQIVDHGVLITKPEDPTRDGYTFGGWYLDDGTFAQPWDFENDVVESDVTLHAKWTVKMPSYVLWITLSGAGLMLIALMAVLWFRERNRRFICCLPPPPPYYGPR